MFRTLPFVLIVWCIAGSVLGPAAQEVVAQDSSVTFVLAGDSTVTDHAGWGLGFKALLRDSKECLNIAKGGRSSRSFRTEGWWQQCLDAQPDYLLIQFGHNDQPGKGPTRESEANGAFREHMAAFVDEARARNIQPILVTSLTRRRWNLDGTIEPTLAEYAEATAAVAADKQVPLIDLHRLSIAQCEAMGATAFQAFEPMTTDGADHTHLNSEGSLAVAELVVSELIRLIPELAPHFPADRLTAAHVSHTENRDVSSGTLRVLEDAEAITISDESRTILVYNKQSPPVPDGIPAIYQRSGFLHPVMSPQGKCVTASFPADHAHQHGIFSAWVSTTWNERDIDFWNLAKATGRVLHQRVISAFADNDRAGFEVDLIHRAEIAPVVDILRERWRITAFATDGSYHVFDLQSTQQSLTDLPLDVHQYHYGGFAVRGPMEWLSINDRDQINDRNGNPSDCIMLNDRGSDRIKGNHEKSRWVSMSGQLDGNPVTITMLCHRENPRAPQSARLHPTKPYFCFAPCVEGPLVIDRQHPFVSRYRYLITDGEPDADWIERHWESWNESTELN